ncbi:uncharacterized protein [Clytia hemisphaerica]|uniref:uncharacterized protein n=1 Tax=Clytia hemisphaerica TaxID=252671 RepID=UPI0034D3B504
MKKFERSKFFLLCFLTLYIQYIGAKFYSTHSIKQPDTNCLVKFLESKRNSLTECISRCRIKGRRNLMVDYRCYCVPHDEKIEENCKIVESEPGESGGNSYLYQSSIHGPWELITNQSICYGSRDDSFAKFNLPRDGYIASFRMVHISGYVGCHYNNGGYWGCNNYFDANAIMTVITESNHEPWRALQSTQRSRTTSLVRK